jgi:type VI secretion system protein ImpH
MAAQSRTANSSLKDILFREFPDEETGFEGYRFDFFQAVRLLERLFPKRQPVGQDTIPSQEVVRFHAHTSLTFPPSAIHEIVLGGERSSAAEFPLVKDKTPDQGNSLENERSSQPQMTVAFMGLTGPLGILPNHYTELLLTHDANHALRDFLDLFNHRLISLFYRAWEKYNLPVAYERAAAKDNGENDPFTLALFDLIGMGTGGLRGRLPVDDEALLFYAGLFAQRPHSASALAALLQDYFEVPVAVVQFVGEWLSLSDESRTRLGTANNRLGIDAVAGNTVWDQHARFRLQLGPLTFAEFCRFLPQERAFRALVQLTHLFAGEEWDFEIQLILKAAEVPQWRLGKVKPHVPPPLLGRSLWLNRKCPTDADDAVFVGRFTGWGAYQQADKEGSRA